MFWLTLMGSLGGLVAMLSLIYFVGRGIFKQIAATEDLSAAVKDLTGSIDVIKNVLNSHETRIAVLEDRLKR